MNEKTQQQKLPSSAVTRLTGALIAGVVTGVALGFVSRPTTAVLAGIAVISTVFVIAGWFVLWPMDAATTRRYAQREGFQPKTEEVVVVGASVSSLVSIVVLLVFGGSASAQVDAAFSLGGVSMAWAALHLMYATRYAHLYYAGDSEGIDFNSSKPPPYPDFLYFSYAVGMTYGVTDTSVSSSTIRAVVLRHSLLSFVFGTVILATMLNLVTGIVTG